MDDAGTIFAADAVPPVVRPKLARWMFDRKITLKQAGAALDVSRETVRLAIRPYDQGYREPSDSLKAKIEDWTTGAVKVDDWSGRCRVCQSVLRRARR